LARYDDDATFSPPFFGGHFDPHNDAMTASGSPGAGGIAGALAAEGQKLPEFDSLTNPLIVPSQGSTYAANTVHVAATDVNTADETMTYRPGAGWAPYTDQEISLTGAGQGSIKSQNPNAPNVGQKAPWARGAGTHAIGGRS
jgi:hypothetical protein